MPGRRRSRLARSFYAAVVRRRLDLIELVCLAGGRCNRAAAPLLLHY